MFKPAFLAIVLEGMGIDHDHEYEHERKKV
jgi:hypothetical protein